MAPGGKLGSRETWTVALVAAVKASVRAEFKGTLAAKGVEGYLTRALAGLEAAMGKPAGTADLRRYVYCLSALLLHESQGGLTGGQVQKLFEIAHAILQRQGIQPGRSRLDFLYGELHLVLGHIYRQDGRAFAAAWQQLLAGALARQTSPEGAGLAALALAQRVLRLGDASQAAACFLEAEAHELSPRTFAAARLGRIQSLRLADRGGESAALLRTTQALPKLSATARLELTWEAFRGAQSELGLAAMMAAIHRGGTHREASYLLEAALWARAVAGRQWLSHIHGAETIRKLSTEGMQRTNVNTPLYQYVSVLESCYDRASALSVRMMRLGEALESCGHIQSIDGELLAWLAAGRWLQRARQPDIARLAYHEYQARSFRLTAGRNGDVLHLVDGQGELKDMEAEARDAS